MSMNDVPARNPAIVYAHPGRLPTPPLMVSVTQCRYGEEVCGPQVGWQRKDQTVLLSGLSTSVSGLTSGPGRSRRSGSACISRTESPAPTREDGPQWR